MKNLKFLIVLLLVLALGVGGYFGYTKYFKTKQNEPPTVRIGEELFQGSMQNAQGFYQVEQTDVDAYNAKQQEHSLEGDIIEVKKSLHFYYSTTDITVQQIIDSMVPVAYNKLSILHYNIVEQKFYAYPKKLNDDMEEVAAPEETIIPAYQGFMIYSTKATTIISPSIKGEMQLATPLGPYLTDFINATEANGWILCPTPIDIAGFDTYIRANFGVDRKITAIFVQDGENSFKNLAPNMILPQADVIIRPQNNYAMVWINVTGTEEVIEDNIPIDCTSCINITDANTSALCSICNMRVDGTIVERTQCTNCTGCNEDLTCETCQACELSPAVITNCQGCHGWSGSFPQVPSSGHCDTCDITRNGQLSAGNTCTDCSNCVVANSACQTCNTCAGEIIPAAGPTAEMVLSNLLNNLADGNIAGINASLPQASVQELQKLQANVNEWSQSLVNKIHEMVYNAPSMSDQAYIDARFSKFERFLNDSIIIDDNQQMQYLILVQLLHPDDAMDVDKDAFLVALKSAEIQVTSTNEQTATLQISVTMGGEGAPVVNNTVTMVKDDTNWIPSLLSPDSIAIVTGNISRNLPLNILFNRARLKEVLDYYSFHLASYYNKIIRLPQSITLPFIVDSGTSTISNIPPHNEDVGITGPFINTMTEDNEYSLVNEGEDLIIIVQGEGRDITMQLYYINVISENDVDGKNCINCAGNTCELCMASNNAAKRNCTNCSNVLDATGQYKCIECPERVESFTDCTNPPNDVDYGFCENQQFINCTNCEKQPRTCLFCAEAASN